MDRNSSSTERWAKAAQRTSQHGGSPSPDWYLYYYMYRLSARHPKAETPMDVETTAEVPGNDLSAVK